jgi:hypothetical protein
MTGTFASPRTVGPVSLPDPAGLLLRPETSSLNDRTEVGTNREHFKGLRQL